MNTTPSPDSSPIENRPAAFTACPIGQAERLARYARKTFGADAQGIVAELTAWRYRERLTLSDTLLVEIARQVAA